MVIFHLYGSRKDTSAVVQEELKAFSSILILTERFLYSSLVDHTSPDTAQLKCIGRRGKMTQVLDCDIDVLLTA